MNSLKDIYNLVAATRQTHFRGLREEFTPLDNTQLTTLEGMISQAFNEVGRTGDILPHNATEALSAAKTVIGRSKKMPDTKSVTETYWEKEHDGLRIQKTRDVEVPNTEKTELLSAMQSMIYHELKVHCAPK